ncbi:thymidine phosphorylase [Chloroflexi bacterium TSY]|nr:thymidine phosphorylase [Chloroflexi bacterium TSY]
MNPVDIIIKKRDGHKLTPDEIRFFIDGFVSGAIPDYQVAAWAMAVYFQGMDAAETTILTQAMAESGEQLDLRDAVSPGTLIVDKHSSGGVGDKTTLAVGPIVAACGLPVGKMSGRGLGFTGGTIDKLESIAGWSPDLSEAAFKEQLRSVGLVVAGQTTNLAPADKTLYALRDVTGTVASLPLIASSIMSKKLAAGADAIVLDVKCGHGAFMESLAQARALGELMVAIGTRAGRRMTALITQMEQPLGSAVGHALEVKEAIDTLQGNGPTDFQELVETVATEMLILAESDRQKSSGEERTRELMQGKIRQAISSGAALIKFTEFVSAQGGEPKMVEEPTLLPTAPVVVPVLSLATGFVQQIDAREIGLAVVGLGGGRQAKDEAIDHRVGVVCQAKVGDPVAAGEPLCMVHAANESDASAAAERIRAAYRFSDEPHSRLPVLYERIGHI